MIKPEVLRALIAAGATAEMIVAAVEADTAAEAARMAAKRANNAERQRRFKERKKQEQEPEGNAGNALLTVINGGNEGQQKCPPDPLKDNINITPESSSNSHAPGGVIVRLPRKESRKAARAAKAPAYTGDFEIFWSEYPRQKNTSKAEAFDVFDRLNSDDQTAAIEGAIAYAEHCRKEQTPERFIAHAATFLRQRRWECAA